MKYISIFPDYPISIHQMEELKRYRKKVLHARIEASSLIRILNGPSRILRTVDGHHVNKSYIVAARDYINPSDIRSRLAEYERRTQVNLYVSLELSTLEQISGIMAVRRIGADAELCLEKALSPTESGEFIGMLTDWNTTNKLDTLIDPAVMEVMNSANLSHSYLAFNRNHIKSFVLVRDLGDEPVDKVIRPKTTPV